MMISAYVAILPWRSYSVNAGAIGCAFHRPGHGHQHLRWDLRVVAHVVDTSPTNLHDEQLHVGESHHEAGSIHSLDLTADALGHLAMRLGFIHEGSKEISAQHIMLGIVRSCSLGDDGKRRRDDRFCKSRRQIHELNLKNGCTVWL